MIRADELLGRAATGPSRTGRCDAAQRLTRTWTSPDAFAARDDFLLAPSRPALESPGFCDLRFETGHRASPDLRISLPASRAKIPGIRVDQFGCASFRRRDHLRGFKRVDPALDRVSVASSAGGMRFLTISGVGRVCDDIVKLHQQDRAGKHPHLELAAVKLGKFALDVGAPPV